MRKQAQITIKGQVTVSRGGHRAPWRTTRRPPGLLKGLATKSACITNSICILQSTAVAATAGLVPAERRSTPGCASYPDDDHRVSLLKDQSFRPTTVAPEPGRSQTLPGVVERDDGRAAAGSPCRRVGLWNETI